MLIFVECNLFADLGLVKKCGTSTRKKTYKLPGREGCHVGGQNRRSGQTDY